MTKTLIEVYNDNELQLDEGRQWGTDKLTKHPYASDYDKIFDPIRNDPIKLLEVGVYHGASMILWDKYFVNGIITGLDIEPRKSFENVKDKTDPSRTNIIIADAYLKEVADKFDELDVAIDDGPHSLESMKSFIELYWPKIKKNGYLVIEDIQAPDWLVILADMITGGDVEKIDYLALGRGSASDSRLLIAKKL
jgi:hypothetical protein